MYYDANDVVCKVCEAVGEDGCLSNIIFFCIEILCHKW